jgi:Spy/CpxP family protein refolding chaperone
MRKNIFTVTAIGLSVLMLAACTPAVAPQPTPSPEAMMQQDASISGQIDISDDAVTQKEATKTMTPKQKMDNDTDNSR